MQKKENRHQKYATLTVAVLRKSITSYCFYSFIYKSVKPIRAKSTSAHSLVQVKLLPAQLAVTCRHTVDPAHALQSWRLNRLSVMNK